MTPTDRGFAALLADARSRLRAATPAPSALSGHDCALLALARDASPATLYRPGIRKHMVEALGHGATAEEVAETLVVVSVLGMHALTEGIPVLAATLREQERATVDHELDAERRRLWDQHVGQDSYWDGFERDLPGFLNALLRISPESFEAFFAFSALPWRMGHIAPKLKELMYVVIDASPNHLYGPGLRIHARNARRLGATEQELVDAFLIAGRIGEHALEAASEALSGADE